MPRGTHHDEVVMGAPKAQHHPGGGIALQPAQGEQHLLLVPHPADVVLQAGVLSDVVEAGRHWHVNHRAGLAGIAWKRKEKRVLKEEFYYWRCPLPVTALQCLCQGEILGKSCLKTAEISHSSSTSPN